ncbi:MAG TPA: LUD domain-containing protein [Anaerolineales bacterium]|jgi:L-lactate dehydrogenase complex protein LldG
MTNPTIENIRRSLGRTDQSALSPRPAIYPPRQTESAAAEIDRFLREIKKLSGVGRKLSAGDVEPALRTLLSEQDIHTATAWDTAFLKQLGITEMLQAQGVKLVSPNADKREMAKCDLGITEADYVLPETGTLVLRSSYEKPRAVSLLPRVHLAIVRPDSLRADMHQVFAEAKHDHYLLFITGPSRTADIELTVTLGVHGPRNLYVWVQTPQ